MSVDIEDFLDGYYFVARRRGQLARYVRRHLRTALEEATTLAAGRESDEPAALFYALARHERALPPELWGMVVERFAVGRARALGSEVREDIFHQRPFIWHIWDGLKRDGFGALVNYHKLDTKLLETLAYNYLGDWIKRQEDGVKNTVDGASERLDAARALQKKLALILVGEEPYDIFVRWKQLHEQPIGWEPDINDGVRLNIRPFITAGVLRKNPKIDWKKDRGNDPPDAPWGEERINHSHLSLVKKRAARAAREKP